MKKCPWYFHRDYVESIDCFGYYGRFNDVNSSYPWAQYMLPFSVRLNCLFEICLICWSTPILLGISFSQVLWLCPIDFGLFSFSFFSMYLLIYSLISLLTYSLFNRILFSLQVFVSFSVFFLYLISHFIPLSLESMLCLISVFLNLLKETSLVAKHVVYPGKCFLCT